MKEFSKLRTEAYGDMVGRKQKLLNRSNDAYSKGDLPTMRKAHSLAMKQDSRTRAKYPDESRKSTMSGATKDYTDREKKLGPGKVRDSVEYPEDTNVVAEDAVEEGILDFMSNTPAKPKSKLSLSAMRDIARKQDAKSKMPKVSRASNDSENPNAGFRLVRAEEKEKTEYDYEGDMARGQLQSIINNAQKVHDMLKDNTNIAEWVQSKITLAEDYISTVSNYMMSEIDEAKKMKGEDPCWDDYKMIGTKNKGGKQVPNCVPEEVEHTDESRQVYYINSHKNQDPAVAQAKRIKNKMAKPPMLNSPRTLKMGESYSARNRLVMALDKEKKKREEQDAARAAREAAAQAKTPPPEKEIKEGIARLISKNIKQVTATKSTPQQKADIRLNK
jgi:hypothetical protein